MIAWAGLERLRLGLIDDISAPARARWPLDSSRDEAGAKGLMAPIGIAGAAPGERRSPMWRPAAGLT